MTDLEPITRKEKYLSAIAGTGTPVPAPVTREEIFLNAILERGGTGGNGGGNGRDGQDATINGVNTLAIEQGENVTLTQDGSTLTIAAKDTTYETATATVSGLMSASDKSKLDNMETGAQVNVLENVTVNGSAAPVSGKTAAIAVPTKTSDLANDSGFQTESEVQAAIDAKVSSTYKAAGSAAFATLPALSESNLGLVKNLTEEFTTNADFVEGAGKSYSAGTNVVVALAGTDYKYDVLAGFIDLSGYAKTAAVLDALAGKVDRETGKVLSSNDYTTTEKDKLADIEAGAQKNPGDATAAASGLMSAADKMKLDNMETGAQVNTVTGVKGGAETAYRTGTINLTPANVGAPALDATQQILLDMLAVLEGIDAPVYQTASGNPAAFEDGADNQPVQSLSVNIEPVQSGSGEPSFTNIRPITGWSSVSLQHYGQDETDRLSTVTLSLGEAGTVYGGTLDVTAGLLTVTGAGIVCTGNDGWFDWGNDNKVHLLNLGQAVLDTSTGNPSACSHFNRSDVTAWRLLTQGEYMVSSPYVGVRDATHSPAANYTAYLKEQYEAGTPVTFYYTLAAPVTYQLTPQEVRTLQGVNHIQADTGAVSVMYRADTALTCDALRDAILALGSGM